MIMRSHSLLEVYLNSRIIYNVLDEQAWIEYVNLDDATIKSALNVFRSPSIVMLMPGQNTGTKRKVR